MKKKLCLVAMLCVLLVLMGIVLAACSGVTIEQDPDTGLVTVRGAKSASNGEGGSTSQNPSETTPTRYNVTLTLSNSAAGTVTGAGAYESGAYVTVTATANEGFNFLGWYRDGAEMSTETSYTFPMPEADMALTVQFEAIVVTAFDVTATADPAGACTFSGAGTYEKGSIVTISATPTVGYEFLGWYDGNVRLSGNAGYTFIMPAKAVSLTARFQAVEPTYAVTLTADPAGACTFSGAGSYENGALVQVSAVAAEGYTFLGWYYGETNVSTSAAYAFMMPAQDMALTARFEEVPAVTYTLTLLSNYAGAGSLIGAGSYEAGASVEISATPAEGYNFVGWYRGEDWLTNDATYTFTMPDHNVTYDARFEYATQVSEECEFTFDLTELDPRKSIIILHHVPGDDEYAECMPGGEPFTYTFQAGERYIVASYLHLDAITFTGTIGGCSYEDVEVTLRTCFGEAAVCLKMPNDQIDSPYLNFCIGDHGTFTFTEDDNYGYLTINNVDGPDVSLREIDSSMARGVDAGEEDMFDVYDGEFIISAYGGYATATFDGVYAGTDYHNVELIVSGGRIYSPDGNDTWDFELRDDGILTVTAGEAPTPSIRAGYIGIINTNGSGTVIIQHESSKDVFTEDFSVLKSATGSFEFGNTSYDIITAGYATATFSGMYDGEQYNEIALTLIDGYIHSPTGNSWWRFENGEGGLITLTEFADFEDYILNNSNDSEYVFDLTDLDPEKSILIIQVDDPETPKATFTGGNTGNFQFDNSASYAIGSYDSLIDVRFTGVINGHSCINMKVWTGGYHFGLNSWEYCIFTEEFGYFEFQPGYTGTFILKDEVLPPETPRALMHIDNTEGDHGITVSHREDKDDVEDGVISAGGTDEFDIYHNEYTLHIDGYADAHFTGTYRGQYYFNFELMVEYNTIYSPEDSTCWQFDDADGDCTLTVTVAEGPLCYDVMLNPYPMVACMLSGAGRYEVGATVDAYVMFGTGFEGWYEGDTLRTTDFHYFFTMPERDVTLTARFSTTPIWHTLSVNASPSEGGTVSGGGSYLSGTGVTIEAIPAEGYTFSGWRDSNNNSISGAGMTYSFTMPESDVSYTAVFNAAPVATYKLYLTASPAEGGTVSGAGGYHTQGESITIVATPSEGYTFSGWYNNGDRVSSSSEYTFMMPGDNVSYTAVFEIVQPTMYMVELTADPVEGGTVSGAGDYAPGASVTIVATPSEGYSFYAWYNGSSYVSGSSEYTFEMPSDNVSYTAEFAVEVLPASLYTRVDAYGNESENGNYVLFGSYPQSSVTDASLISLLTSQAGELPTAQNSKDWTSYHHYYIGNTLISNYMWYIDVTYEGEKYRGVYFSDYRHDGFYDPQDPDTPQQFTNGYVTNTVYWFKYEPILWRILYNNGSSATLLCESILDNQEFCLHLGDDRFYHNGGMGYASDYALSDVRMWLISVFFEEAFSDAQKDLIIPQSISGVNGMDPVYLLSKPELLNISYGFSSDGNVKDSKRRKSGTDYAKAQGLYVYEYDPDDPWGVPAYEGFSDWMTRTVHTYYITECNPVTEEPIEVLTNSTDMTVCVTLEGNFDKMDVIEMNNGVVPALKINLN